MLVVCFLGREVKYWDVRVNIGWYIIGVWTALGNGVVLPKLIRLLNKAPQRGFFFAFTHSRIERKIESGFHAISRKLDRRNCMVSRMIHSFSRIHAENEANHAITQIDGGFFIRMHLQILTDTLWAKHTFISNPILLLSRLPKMRLKGKLLRIC